MHEASIDSPTPEHVDHVCLRHVDRVSPFGSLHAADVRMPPGRHDEPALEAIRICLVVEGCFEQHMRMGSRTLTRSAVRVSPPDSSARYRFGAEGGRCFFLEYGIQDSSDRRHLQPNGSLFMRDQCSVQLAWRVYSAFNDPTATPLMLDTLALEMLARAARMPDLPSGPPPVWLKRVRNWLQDCFAEPLTLADAARDANVTTVHLSRAFRHHFGCTMGDYLRAVRVERARQAISQPTGSLVQVALDAGFYDQSHMTREFRRVYGVTPGQYRRSVIDG